MPAIPKPRPKLLSKREAQADVRAEDRAENAKVKQRSGGQCEVRIVSVGPLRLGHTLMFVGRCHRRAGHVHHLRSGIGVRNRGDSIKARCKLHVCDLHHEEIHGHVLTPMNEANRYDAATIKFERVG